jgi:hypothetical protein
MRLLNLDLLVGPGDSVSENFEILCLELAKGEFPDHDCFRVRPPDRGIDIYIRAPNNPSESTVIQCKAYRNFRHQLTAEVATSLSGALAASADYPWSRYILSIPFVPTYDQRRDLEQVLYACERERNATSMLRDRSNAGDFELRFNPGYGGDSSIRPQALWRSCKGTQKKEGTVTLGMCYQYALTKILGDVCASEPREHGFAAGIFTRRRPLIQ